MLRSPIHEVTNYHPPIAGLKRKCAAPPLPVGDYPTCIQIAAVGRPGRRLTIVKCGRPPGPLKHDRTTKHRNRNRTSDFFRLNIGTSDVLPESAALYQRPTHNDCIWLEEAGHGNKGHHWSKEWWRLITWWLSGWSSEEDTAVKRRRLCILDVFCWQSSHHRVL